MIGLLWLQGAPQPPPHSLAPALGGGAGSGPCGSGLWSRALPAGSSRACPSGA